MRLRISERVFVNLATADAFEISCVGVTILWRRFPTFIFEYPSEDMPFITWELEEENFFLEVSSEHPQCEKLKIWIET